MRGESKAALGGGLVKHRQPGMEQRKGGRHGPRKDRSRNGMDLGHKRPAWEEQEWLDGESTQRVGVSGKVQESGLGPVQEGQSLGSQSRSRKSKRDT